MDANLLVPEANINSSPAASVWYVDFCPFNVEWNNTSDNFTPPGFAEYTISLTLAYPLTTYTNLPQGWEQATLKKLEFMWFEVGGSGIEYSKGYKVLLPTTNRDINNVPIPWTLQVVTPVNCKIFQAWDDIYPGISEQGTVSLNDYH